MALCMALCRVQEKFRLQERMLAAITQQRRQAEAKRKRYEQAEAVAAAQEAAQADEAGSESEGFDAEAARAMAEALQDSNKQEDEPPCHDPSVWAQVRAGSRQTQQLGQCSLVCTGVQVAATLPGSHFQLSVR